MNSPLTRQELRETLRNAVRAGDLEAVEAAMVTFAYNSDQLDITPFPNCWDKSDSTPQASLAEIGDHMINHQSPSSTEHKNAKA